MPAFIDENQQFIDPDTSAPIVNGTVFFGEQGANPTDEPITVFEDRALQMPIGESIQTDASGRTTQKVWIPGRYSFKVVTSQNVQKLIDLDAGSIASVGITVLGNIAGSNIITASADPPLDTLVNGQQFTFTAVAINTDDMTLAIDQTGAKPILFNFAEQMAPGFIQQNATVNLTYNSTEDAYFWGNEGRGISLLTNVAGDGNAITADGGPSTTGYVENQLLEFKANLGNTDNVTLKVGTLPTVSVKIQGVELPAGALKQNITYLVSYNTTGPVFELISNISGPLLKPLDTNGFSINESQGASVASAAQPNIWAGDGDTLHITGVTQVEDFTDAPRIGAKKTIIFDGILVFKTGLGITQQGGQDIITVPGDRAEIYADAVDAFTATYFRKDGRALINIALETQITASGQTDLSFIGLSLGIKQIFLQFNKLIGSANTDFEVQIGASGVFQTAGYVSSSSRLQNASLPSTIDSTIGFNLNRGLAADAVSGIMTLNLMDIDTNSWITSHACKMGNGVAAVGGGARTLPGVLDRLRVRVTSGVFSSGDISLQFLQ